MPVTLPSHLICPLSWQTSSSQEVEISVAGQTQIKGTSPELRDVWEETAFVLERLQVKTRDGEWEGYIKGWCCV